MARYEFKSDVLRINQYRIYDFFNRQNYGYFEKNFRASQLELKNLKEQYLINPEFVLRVIYSYRKNHKKNFFDLVNSMIGRSIVGTILGKRRHGKTGFLSSLMEEYHKKGVYIAVLNFSRSEKVPKWVNHHEYINDDPYSDIPPNALIIHDEIHLDMNSKDFTSPSNAKFRNYLSTSGHKPHTIIFSSQLASNIPLDLMKYADLKIFKPMNQDNITSDRADYLFKYSLFYPEKKTDFLADLEGNIFYGVNTLPEWYGKEVSEAFK